MKNKFGALINVRLESNRFPYKAKKKIYNLTLIEILIRRLLAVEDRNNIVICTYKSISNNYFKKIAKKYRVNIYFGSKNNLLLRMINCSKIYNFNYVYRITGDNPFIDFKNYLNLKNVILKKKNLEYVYSNIPCRGMRCELLSVKALKKIYKKSIIKNNIDYLSYYFFRDNFLKKKILQNKKKRNNITFSIDYKKQYLLIKNFIQNKKISILENSELIHKLAIKNKLLAKQLKINNQKYIFLKTDEYDCRIKGDKKDKKIKSYF